MPTLGLDRPVSGEFTEAGAGITYPLDIKPGDYVQGVLMSGEASFDLWLVNAEGKNVRRLLDNSRGRRVFRFVAAEGDAALRLGNHHPGVYSLSLSRRLPAAEQAQAPSAKPQSQIIQEVARKLGQGESSDAFWAEVEKDGLPLIEPLPPAEDGTEQVLMTFLVRGARSNAMLLGAPTNDHEKLIRLGESNIWYRSFAIPATTRLSYRIAPDVPVLPEGGRAAREAILAQVQADPYNKSAFPPDAPDRFNQWSRVELPGAPTQPGIGKTPERVGEVKSERFRSAILNNDREVAIYTPSGFDPQSPDTVVLVMLDGVEYRQLVSLPTILDNLIADGQLPQVVVLFVDSIDSTIRSHELTANPDFGQAIATELLPWAEQKLGLKTVPERTVIAGSSYGGLSASATSLAHPDRFGAAIAMSGSFWWSPPGTPAADPRHIAAQVLKEERQPVRFFLSAGLFEYGRSDRTAGILETSRQLRDLLQAKGYEVAYREYAAGHDYFAWQGVIGDGLLTLFGRQPVATPPASGAAPAGETVPEDIKTSGPGQ